MIFSQALRPRRPAAWLLAAAAAAAAGCESDRAPVSVPAPVPVPATTTPDIDEPAGIVLPDPPPDPQHLPTVELVAGVRRIRAEVARSEATRQRGLMARRDVAGDAGMLFVFPRTELRTFWMKNTPSALSIAFIADDGRISQIEDMKPFDLAYTRSREAVRYALEMPRGWFESAGLKPGDKVHGLERAGEARD